MNTDSIEQRISRLVLGVHRRNGGTLEQLDFSVRLLDPVLRIDSLDLAEIMVEVEREFGGSPFDAPRPPRTWADVVRFAEGGRGTAE
ncbi:MAG TPA: hypothetical protein PKM73_04395 [Verrucomicrobiota bacterium]|nr:hypothetical protein [Verrucomicrobiota bacterium]